MGAVILVPTLLQNQASEAGDWTEVKPGLPWVDRKLDCICDRFDDRFILFAVM